MSSESTAIMHLDGCHFYIWVGEHGGKQRLQWSERCGSDLAIHSRNDCERCAALRRGAPASENIITTLDPPLPTGTQEAFVHILEVIAGNERMIA